MSIGTIGTVTRGASSDNPVMVNPANVKAKFHDPFETFNTSSKWNYVQSGSGDFIIPEGNAVGSSYLVISKSPLTTGSVSIIESQQTFKLPVELIAGLHMSQRTLGQEFSLEVVSTDDPLAPTPDILIATASQAATVLTITTLTEHGLVPGKRIGLQNFASSSFNYPSLVVATIPTSNSLTITAGPGGTIPSITATLTSSAAQSASIYFRPALNYSKDGTSMIFENATVTNASFYIRSDAGDALPVVAAANLNANHSSTVGTTATVQAINTPFTYAFQPTNEYRLLAQSDRIQWYDVGVDVQTAPTSRALRTQVAPSPLKDYKIRFRAVNQPSLTVPVAQIVSAVKSGTTVATITCDRPHGLRLSDAVVIYGIRDQAAASFPNILTATAIGSIVSDTVFTIGIGTASTVTSYGGYVAKVQGGNLMSALAGITSVVQSATYTANNQLTLVTNAAIGGVSIGDNIELVGVRDNTTGASLNIDGAWKIANIVTTTTTLVPIPEVSPSVAPFATTNCGGGLIKRTELRISYLRVLDYERQRVEGANRPTGDIATSIPVTINNTAAVTISSGTVTTVTTVTAVTTVSTLTNQTQAGGFAMQDQVPSLMRIAAQGLRRNVSIT